MSRCASAPASAACVVAEPELDFDAGSRHAGDFDVLGPGVEEAGLADAVRGTPAANGPQLSECLLQRGQALREPDRLVVVP